jgi:two-component system NtrC family sensor kinase
MPYAEVRAWLTGLELLIPQLTPSAFAALIMLAASVLVFRTFRERYLLVWIVGWVVYLAARTAGSGGVAGLPLKYSQAIGETGFVLAVSLFAAAILLSVNARRALLVVLFVGSLAVSAAAVQATLWPGQMVLRASLEILYRVITFGSAFHLLALTRGKWRLGPVVLAITLMALHLDWGPLAGHPAPAVDVCIDLLFGLSMLMVVLDQYRDRTLRLVAVTALTTSIARAQHPGTMLLSTLEELVRLINAKAGWFRLLEEGSLRLVQHIGVSDEFVRSSSVTTLDEATEKILHTGWPVVQKVGALHPSLRGAALAEGFHHILLVPIRGKKAILGTLSLASARARSYSREELAFLATSANQVGIAAENLRLREQIVRSQRQWINTFDSIEDMILLHDANHKILKVNRSLMRRLKLRPAEMVGHLCEEVLPQHSAWKNCPYCLQVEAGLAEHPDPCLGGFSLVSTSSYREHGQERRGTIHVIRDTSARRAAEEKYRMLFEQAQEGVFVADPKGKLLDCNDAFVRMLGYSSRDELMALELDHGIYTSSEQRESVRCELEARSYIRNFEVALRRKDGTVLNAMESSFATRDAEGRLERYQGFLLDTSEKRRADDEIRRRNRELNALNAIAIISTQSFDLDEILNLTLRQVVTLFSSETGSIYLADPGGQVLRRRAGWGPRSEGRARFSELRLPDGFGELIMRSRTEVITPEYLPHVPEVVAEFIKADGARSWVWVILWGKDGPAGVIGVGSREAREFTTSDESLLVAISRQLAATLEKVRLYEESCRAYENLRLAQEQLLQSEKMSAVGQLISGVAHELNNPLTAILGYAQLLEGEGLNERAQDFVGKLFKQAQRTHRVVQNLLSFARQRKPQKVEVDIRRVLDEALALRDYDFRVNNVRVERQIEETLPAVVADPHQVEQVFLNVINNALDAMLETQNKGVLKVRSFASDGQVWVEFHDSGPGIEDAKKIFDPFYTTKAVGKGTGLGLSICYGIVKEHGGEISASNSPEGGAVIQLRLPAVDRVAPVVPEPVRVRHDGAIQGRLLLAEDEEAVREFAGAVLAGAGAEVISVSNAEEAKARLQKESFDGIIMSGRMPGGMTIAGMHAWLAETHPELEHKILFTFAHLADEETRAFLEKNKIPSLLKPFEIADLINHTRSLLRKARATASV